MATAYILDQPAVAGVILGVRLGVSAHIEDNAQVFNLKLDSEDRTRIDAVLSASRDLSRRSAIAATSIDNPPPQALILGVADAQPSAGVRVSDAEAECSVMLDDMAGAGRGEVRAKDQYWLSA